ncbi:MAG: glycoside hydrolase family 3 protein [Clostridia bacterium]|nr:glycoside hydrolase family 3 protein [Clostridia bacterium]
MIIDKNIKIQGKKLWEVEPGPVKELLPLCRKLAAEGSVLLKNDGVLPFSQGEKVALFGRTQETYIKSGTGSGGLVRVVKTPCIIESFRENGVFTIDEELAQVYANWILENPFDNGQGWATEPWSQKEMPLSDKLVKSAAERNDVAVIIIGRTAGEDRDNSNTDGSYRLSLEELEMIEKVTANFRETVVVLNVGNIIDLSFMDKFNISALLYVWQGGQEGANALADMLSGKISPCGKLPDTQTKKADDYPYFDNFSDKNESIYEEDIYVGYRYFETFAKDKVRYPFGFGLTYTQFETDYIAKEENGKITVTAVVKNVGNFASREVVQIYYGAPCGKLGTPAKQLAAYKKTKELKPDETQVLEISFDIKQMASYDDSGITGNEFCYVLEAGDYKIYCGTDIRGSECVFTYTLDETVVTQKLEQVMPPEKEFKRFTATLDSNGNRILTKELAPLRKFDLDKRIEERRPEEIAFTGDRGIKLIDVAEGKNTMKEFIAQMSDNDLASIVIGEGMNSPKVTVGTGGAFGGVTDSLLDLGIPVCCVTDGPSGIRIGGDLKSTSLPNGYVFASSFDDELAEQIFELEGIELFAYNIDALLGPGMNIHRHPLCGRNFEYFSEDPLLSGKIAAAQSRGIAKSGCTTTIKHFSCNNQEFARTSVNAVVSERALREIYLKGYEIAVKEGNATAIMTSYNPINGYWSASNYDLTTTVLRNEWGYKGFVMTDWWPLCNCKGKVGTKENLKAMVRAHNDIYMVWGSVLEKPHNLFTGIEEGYVTRGDLQYCAENLLTYIIKSPTFKKFVLGGCKKPEFAVVDESKLEKVAVVENVVSGENYELDFDSDKKCVFVFETECVANSLAQYPITMRVGGHHIISLSVSGNDTGRIIRQFKLSGKYHTFSFEFPKTVKFNRFFIMQ